MAVVVRSSGDGARHAHPDEWDERVVDLVAFVEEARGLRFDHPVFVDFLSEEDYRASATTDDRSLPEEDREAYEREGATLRALGLAAGEMDLREAIDALAGGGTLAYYDPEDGRVRVRGTELTVGVRATLVHELTHALQDQAFDLRRVGGDDLDDPEQLALRSVVEGDATRIELRYVDQVLGAEGRAAYEDERRQAVEAGADDTAAVPGAIVAGFATPYLLGAPFVMLLDAAGGNAAVDEALRDPSATEEHLFDPTSHLAGDGAAALDLDLADDEVLDDGFFGPTSWFLVLAEHLDPFVALEAALGWAGDGYAALERDGTLCVRAAFAGDAPEDEAQMADALEAWVAALGDDRARLLEVDGHPGFEACDPGPDAELELTDRSRDALALPSVRGYLVASFATYAPGPRDATGATCFADAVLAQLTWEDLTDPERAVFAGEAFQELMVDAMLGCIRA